MEDGGRIEANSSDPLILAGFCTFLGGEITGSGAVEQRADLIVAGDVLINPAGYDWDGTGSGSTLTVQTDGHLTIDTQLLDPRNTTLRVRGTLDVTNRTAGGDPAQWFMASQLIAHGASTIDGSEIRLDAGGVLRLASGNAPVAIFRAPLRVEDGGQVQTDPLADLDLRGPTTLDGRGAGEQITGAGDVIQNGPLEVISASQIVCNRYDWDGGADQTTETIIRSGASLLIDVDRFEVIFNDAFNGSIEVETNASLVVQKPDPTWVMAGTMTLAGTSFVDGTAIFNTGRIEGSTAMRTNLEDAGTVAPAGTIAMESFNYYVQTADGTLEIEIAGPTAGIDYGRIDAVLVFTSATLDGRLEVALVGGYVPTVDDVFDVVRGAYSGEFTDVDAPGFDVSYLPDRVRLTFVGGLPCAGDVNGDGAVGFGDILEILAAWGPCPPPCSADANEDGVVNFADVLIVLGTWGPCP